MSRLTSNKSNDDIKNKAISIIRNLTAENDLSYDELAVVSSFLLIERTENNMLKHYEDLEEQGRLIEQRYATTRECCCSACKEDYTRVAEGENGMVWEGEYPNYCPWCGAKFVSEEELKEMEGAK